MNIVKLRGELWQAQEVYDTITHIMITIVNCDKDIDYYKDLMRRTLRKITTIKLKKEAEIKKLKELKTKQAKLRAVDEIQNDIDTIEQSA